MFHSVDLPFQEQDGGPRRISLSAYNIFVRQVEYSYNISPFILHFYIKERANIQEKQFICGLGIPVSQASIGRHAGARWLQMASAEKDQYLILREVQLQESDLGVEKTSVSAP